jgi:adenosylcobinamide amidohydrolase
VFNYDANPGVGIAPENGVHLALLERLGLASDKTAIIATAVPMENVSIVHESQGDLSVCAVVTAGVEVNGGRSGDDPAVWDDIDEVYLDRALHGTINVMCEINARMTPGSMAQAIITLTEAKSCALERVGARSKYSPGIATGSGSDCAIVISCPNASLTALDAASGSLAGELVGRAVTRAVESAVGKTSGLTYEQSHNVASRLSSYGVDENAVFDVFSEEQKKKWEPFARARFHEIADEIFCGGDVYVASLLMARLLDEARWGTLAPEAAMDAAVFLSGTIGGAGAPESGETEALSAFLIKTLSGIVEERAKNT